ncbi:MAG: hypothetical protein C0478_15545 [Planctomyces sp.]|nr:hypothetical protein [Planctomyces sp.]
MDIQADVLRAIWSDKPLKGQRALCRDWQGSERSRPLIRTSGRPDQRGRREVVGDRKVEVSSDEKYLGFAKTPSPATVRASILAFLLALSAFA